MKELINVYKDNKDFYEKQSSDLTMNSRQLISDILNQSINRGLDIKVNEPVQAVTQNQTGVKVETKNNDYFAENVVICSPDFISKYESCNFF